MTSSPDLKELIRALNQPVPSAAASCAKETHASGHHAIMSFTRNVWTSGWTGSPNVLFADRKFKNIAYV
jgi:hypothetical protein